MATIRMNIPQESLKKFNTALLMYTKGLRKEANRTMIQHGRLLARDLIKWTPPQEGKKQGEIAVARDLTNAVTVFDPSTINDPKLAKRLKKIASQKDTVAMQAIFKNLPTFKNKRVVPFAPSLHENVRIRGDVLGVPADQDKVTMDKRPWKDYLKDLKNRVGKLKASWLPLTELLNVSAPSWITRHSAFGHSVTTAEVTVGDNPKIVVWNGAHAQKYLKHAAETALNRRSEAMARDLAYKINYMKTKLGQT